MSKEATRTTRMRTVILSISALVIGIIIIASAGVFILESPWGINLAEAKLTDVIGQEVSIDSIKVDIGRNILLRVENASIVNPSWASSPNLASFDVLTVGIDVLELFLGKLVISGIQITAPMVNLERSTQDKANWETDGGITIPSDDEEEQKNTNNADAVPHAPRIESIVVDDGRLTYSDPNTNTSVELLFGSSDEKISANKSFFVADGGGQVHGQPLRLDLSAGPPSLLTEKDANQYPLKLRLSSAETTLLIEGKVDALLSPDRANLQIRLKGQNLSRWNEVIDMELPKLPTYQFACQVNLVDEVWSVDHIQSTIGNSDIGGTVTIKPDADPRRVEGTLQSTLLDVTQLQNMTPTQQESTPVGKQIATFVGFLGRAMWQAHLQYRADRIKTGELSINDTEISLALKEDALSLESLVSTVEGTQFHVTGQVSADDEAKKGRLQVQLEADPSSPISDTDDARSQGADLVPARLSGKVTGKMTVDFQTDNFAIDKQTTPIPEQHNATQYNVLKSVSIQEFQLQYAEPSAQTAFTVRMDENPSEHAIVIKGKGIYRNEPVELSVLAPELQSFINPKSHRNSQKTLSVDLKLSHATASATATMMPTWPPKNMDLKFWVKSDMPERIAAIFDLEELPTLGKLTLRGRLSKRRNTWRVKDFAGHVGKSEIQGVGMLNSSDEPHFEVMLHSKQLDVAKFISTRGNNEDHPTSESTPVNDQPAKSTSSQNDSPTISIPQWLPSINGKVRFTIERLLLPGTKLNDVLIYLTMNDGLLRIMPFSIPLGGGTIQTRAEVNLVAPSLAGSLHTKIERIDLTQAMQNFGRDAMDLGKVSGEIQLMLPTTDNPVMSPLNLDTLLNRLQIEKVRLRYDDPALKAKTDLHLTSKSMTSGLEIHGTVEYRDKPVDVSLSTGSLRDAFKDYESLDVKTTLEVKQTKIVIEGQVNKIFPLENFTANVTAEGPNPSQLGEAIGIPLPNLPPYRLQAQLQREPETGGVQRFIFENFNGTIGDSDVSGYLRVTTGGKRPLVFTRLHSRKLDLDDLAGLIGASPDPEETASDKQETQSETFDDRNVLLPDKPIAFAQLRKVDADVEYQAKGVQAPDLPLDDFTLNMTLENGHLQMTRLDFGVATGTMGIELEVNARTTPVTAKLATDFDKVNLSQILTRFDVADDSFGNIGGRAKLWMRGESLARWFASADGGLYLTMTGGKVDALLVELAGLDFAESATVFLGTDTSVNIDCAYTDLQARSGIVTIQPFLFDTKDTKFKGYGKVDLRQEKMELTVKPFPKDFTLLSSRGPLHMTGTFKKPNFSVEPSFPSPEFGTADDSARCVGMIEKLRKTRKSARDNSITKEDSISEREISSISTSH